MLLNILKKLVKLIIVAFQSTYCIIKIPNTELHQLRGMVEEIRVDVDFSNELRTLPKKSYCRFLHVVIFMSSFYQNIQ